MKNIKSVAICAASGFILSLICGFFSKSGFGRIFLIALIFGIIFGVLGFVISFLFDKFLTVETVAAEPSEGYSGEMSASIPVSNKSVGQHVDIVIQDEPLEQSGNPNHYDVGENHQMLNESDYNNSNSGNKQENGEKPIVAKNEFVPIRNLETVTNFSGNEAETPQEAQERREAIERQEEEKGSELDTLPDMSELQVAAGSDGSDDNTITISDSEEAQFVHSATNYKSSDISDGEIKDASLMAKAISSILAEEET
ncbi:MAG: YrzE family protein [Treponema sp.]|nr:YrzE family protein [Treponema sp.]